MEKNSIEDLSYKELVRHLIGQIDQMNACYKSLDEREVHLQRMMERVQTTLDYKADKEELINLVGILNTQQAKDDTKETERNKSSNTWKWAAGMIITALIFAGTQLIQHWPK